MIARMAISLRVATAACVVMVGVQLLQTCVAQEISATSAAECGPLREVGETSGLLDYRLRDTEPRVQQGVALINRFHTDRARQFLSSPSDSIARTAISDLDFTLRHSPNHHEALRLLLEWHHRGGKSYEYPSIECFFTWAREFAPTDAAVAQLTAQYYWKIGDLTQAQELFGQALRLDPDSSELNYNAGLFYFARKDYAKARKHAQIAYAAGYPLPGLRNMLEREKQWTGH
ncbi:MAG TPA: tetratricopeptide repeat protein [Steroidobacteraceae bacterium]|nr:tetratricopeptide repeat protein [Steroidobacteraceae bacterium]